MIPMLTPFNLPTSDMVNSFVCLPDMACTYLREVGFSYLHKQVQERDTLSTLLIGNEDHEQEHCKAYLHMVYQYYPRVRNLWLLVVSIIILFMFSNKNNLVFTLGLVQIMRYIYERGIFYAWVSCILAQLYYNLYYIVTVGNSNVTVAHSSLIQAWTYKYIAMFRLIGLGKKQNDHINPTMYSQVSSLCYLQAPCDIEERKREINNLQVEDIMWVAYQDYAWVEDTHQTTWMR